MKVITKEAYASIRQWVCRNARPVGMALWRCCMEGAAITELAKALTAYQNADGGFGHGLEADCWNPASAPCQAERALHLLRLTGQTLDGSLPPAKGLLRYLSGDDGRAEHGWAFRVPGNNLHPHAPWWTYSPDNSEWFENIGVTATLSAFILTNAPEDAPVYRRAQGDAARLTTLLDSENLGDMGIAGLLTLLDVPGSPLAAHREKILRRAHNAIERDRTKWHLYTVRPSAYIHSPQSPLYPDNERLVEEELDFLIDTLPEGGVWPIPWTWYDNMSAYAAQFAIAENWWKAERAAETLLFLRAFGRLDT